MFFFWLNGRKKKEEHKETDGIQIRSDKFFFLIAYI